jgi:hypothetical protein
MSYCPPHKRNSAPSLSNANVSVSKTKTNSLEKNKSKGLAKDEFPALGPVPVLAPVSEAKPKMDFSSLFKNVEKKKNKPKKLKWGTVLLTKKGMIDSMTAEEREEEENWKIKQDQEERLWSMADRLVSQQNVRRVFDPLYESPDELTVSTSEEDPEEEEEEVLTDEFEEGEFEPEI